MRTDREGAAWMSPSTERYAALYAMNGAGGSPGRQGLRLRNNAFKTIGMRKNVPSGKGESLPPLFLLTVE